MKLFYLTPLAALLAAPAFGQIVWTNAAANNNFADGANWNPVNTPFSGSNREYDVNLLGADRAVLSTALGNLQRDLRIGDTDGQGELLITTGGSITVTRNMRLGRGGDGFTGFGIATVDGGSLTINNRLFVGQSANTGNVFSLNSGTVSTGDQLNVAHSGDTYGTLNIAGGTFTVASGGAVFSDGGGAPSTSFLNLSGNGVMNVGGNISFANNDGGATSTVSISDTASLSANQVRFGEGSNSVASLSISDTASVSGTAVRFGQGAGSEVSLNMSGGQIQSSGGINVGFGADSKVDMEISGGFIGAATFITMGQALGTEVTVNMSGGEINADRLIFANEGTGILNMTGGTINLADTGGGQTTAGALVMGSVGAALNIGGDAVINADKLRINNGGLLTLGGNALINIAGAGDGNETFDFSIGLAPAFLGGGWGNVDGQIEFASLGASLVVAGSGETVGGNSINFLSLFNAAIANDVFYTNTGFSFSTGYDAGNDLTFVTLIPEPSTYALIFGAGMLLVVLRRRLSARS